MTLKREFPNFDVVLDIKDPDFAEAPSDFQRRWMLSRAVSEFGDDVEHLGGQIARFVPGEERSAIEHSWQSSPAQLDETELLIENQQVMQAWEKPLMRSLAQAAAQGHGDVLEVGFGMGISASYLQEAGLRSYTVIE
ncbi:MAG: hypothetical protein MJE66_11125 [Proteobacteria bacterium]|nr:hypothetical protein [Pseudomonadota bacterium]